VSDDALKRKVDISAGTKAVAEANKEMLTKLEQVRDSEPKDVARYQFVLEQAIDTTRDSAELAQEDLQKRSTDVQVRAKKEIEITIPAGIENGTRMRVSGQGEASRDGGPPGDLYCDIYVREHEFFKRHENDIVCEIPVSFAQAAMGSEIEVPTLQGKSLLKIPKGTASGALLRMRGLGVTAVNGRGKGDQIVRVVVNVPTKLTKRQEEILAEFAKIEQEQSGKKHFWEKFFGP